MCRKHDIAYSRSNDLTDKHADRVLANKALGRVFARDSVLSKIAVAATIWAMMKAKIKSGMGIKEDAEEDDDEEKSDEKADTSDNETCFYQYWVRLSS